MNHKEESIFSSRPHHDIPINQPCGLDSFIYTGLLKLIPVNQVTSRQMGFISVLLTLETCNLSGKTSCIKELSSLNDDQASSTWAMLPGAERDEVTSPFGGARVLQMPG